MNLQLEGLAAAVTGGSEGVGRAIAEVLAREGCDVALAARRRDVLEDAAHDIAQESGRRVLPIQADLSRADDARTFVATAARSLGRLDILVNNAGGPGAHRFDGASDEIWQADLDVKLFGAIRCSRAALPYLRRAGGSIVNITSTGGREPSQASVPTSVTRAAGIALTKAMSKEYADAGVRVNTVMLGSIRSAQWERRWEATGRHGTLEDFYDRAGVAIPLGRIGRPEEVGDLVAFLVSSRAAYITGAAIALDGGLSNTI